MTYDATKQRVAVKQKGYLIFKNYLQACKHQIQYIISNVVLNGIHISVGFDVGGDFWYTPNF